MEQLPATHELHVGGRVIFLIDESEGLRECIAGGTKSKAESIATALNSLLNQLCTVPDLEVAIAGYRGDGAGGAEIRCRWGGPLAARRFVHTTELAAAPQVVENRTRRMPAAAGRYAEETVRFPIWYIPQLGGSIFPVLGYAYVRHLIVSGTTAETTWSKPPLVISFVGNWLPQQVETAVERVQALSSPGGRPLLFHVHVGGAAPGQPVLFPSTENYLPAGTPRDLFRWSSVLPPFMVSWLRAAGMSVGMGARGMVYNATVTDVIRLLSLVKAYAQQQGSAVPPPAAEQIAVTPPAPPPVESPCAVAPPTVSSASALLLILAVDRAVSDPASDVARKAWSRLQDHANDLLTTISRKAAGLPIEVAMLTYGATTEGQAELRSFDGPLATCQVVTAADLANGPVRIDEFSEKMSNGIGGLITLNRKRAIYLDQPASGDSTVAVGPAFAAIAQLTAAWRHSHPEGCVLVLRLGRDQFDAATLIPALDYLYREGTILYHHVVTESPQRSLAYVESADKIDNGNLASLWQQTSPLLSAERLTAERRIPSPAARGFVINGRFDLLLDGILDLVRADALAAGTGG